nr:hypothetical protein [Tanacetum cinerariifolium]
MDSIISIGQKNSLAEYMILYGANNRPSMLDKDLKWGDQDKEFAELPATEKIQADCDLKETNIILQGLSYDIYSLVNHHKVAKDLWEKVKLIMQGTSLTKQERECKFLPPEWSKFETDVKLLKDLHTTNFDELHAYLEQHELHANEVCFMHERSQDPLALVTNHQMTPSHFNTYQSSYNNPQFQQQQQQFSPSQKWGDQDKEFAELPATEKIQADCDLKETNIILQGLSYDIYSLVNHHKVAKDLWEKVKLIMQGTSLTKQERECKFLPPEWSKFETDVKLVKDLHTTNFDELHAYLEQHELHANEVCLMHERCQDPLALVTNHQLTPSHFNTYQSSYNNPQFQQQQQQQFSPSQVTVQPLQRRQNSYSAGTSGTRSNTLGTGGNYSGQQRVVKCFNCQGEGHMARQCPKPKRKKDATWSLPEEEGWNRIKEYVQYQDDLWDNPSPSMNISSITEGEEESGPKWVIRSKFEDELAGFMLKKKFHTKSIGEMLDQHRKEIHEKISRILTIIEECKILESGEPTFVITTRSGAGTRDPLFLNPLMEAAVQQYHVDKQCFEIQKKQFLIENDRLLDQIISQDIVNIFVNSSMDINTSVNVNSSVAMNDSVNYVETCNKCLELEAELIKQHNMVEKDEYNRLLKSFSKLEQHCISLELAMQLNKEKFQKNNTSVNQTKPLFDRLFELNNLKAKIQAKDTTIKRKDIVNNAAQVSNETTIALGMYKLDPVTLAPNDKNNRKTHIYYLKHTMEQAAILREIVKQAKSLNPLDSASYSTCKYVKLIQELLRYVRDTCPNIYKPSEKLVAVTPINKKKIVSESVIKDVDEIETINIELEHRVTRPIAKNEHLKQTYKQLYDLIKASRVRAKEQTKSLVNQAKNNRETHEYYLKRTIEQVAILREVVEQAKSRNPLDSASYSAFFQKGDDPIDAINHMMSFLTSIVTSRYPSTNNQLKTSSNPRQQAINNGRVTIQPIQGRQNSITAGSSRPYTSGLSGTLGKQIVIMCYNCKGEGHMSKQCTKPKRKRDEQWFKDKVLLVQAQANGQVLQEEELELLADPGIAETSST